MAEIAYLVHDLADAAVARRVRMLRAGGAEVSLAGFHRRTTPLAVDGVAAVDLGRTADARLGQRAAAVARNVARPGQARSVVARADAILARNLEALAIAVRVARPDQRIVFECLDIHRLLTASGSAGILLRAIERRLLARAALVLTSSPAFEREYFRALQGYRLPVRVEENKVVALDGVKPALHEAANDGPPWRIGWFGMLRCRRTLAILRELVRLGAGRVEVLIAGIPALTEFDDFHRDVGDLPGLRFVGPYTAGDLPQLYGEVHFAWAIDYFEEGLNSTWLLPNRLYESLAHGAVPIALRHVETGHWLAGRKTGVLVDDPTRELRSMLGQLDPADYAELRRSVAQVPSADVLTTRQDCVALTRAILGQPA